MRRRILFGSLIAGTLFLLYGALRAQDPPKKNEAAGGVIGTWKMISAKYGGEEADLTKTEITLKHVTPVSFLWVTYDSETKQVLRMAGGTYTLKGEQYVERPQYGLGEDFEQIREKAHAFTLKIEGDTWHHNGALADGLKIDEVWERVKAK
jgi:hypothetical protein